MREKVADRPDEGAASNETLQLLCSGFGGPSPAFGTLSRRRERDPPPFF